MKLRSKLLAGLAAALALTGPAVAAPAVAAPPTPSPGSQAARPDAPGRVRLAERPLKGVPLGKGVVKGNPNTLKNVAPAPVPAGGTVAATTTGPGTYYRYAIAKDTSVTGSTGAQITMSVHKPSVLSYDFHSLGEQAVQDTGGNNTVEVGYTVDRTTFGDDDPHLFVFHWVNNVGQGYNANFTPVASPVITPGANLASLIGSTITVRWEYFPASCGCATPGWWLKYNSGTNAAQWIGLFPDTNWTGQGASFTTPALVQEFGEVAVAYDPSQTKMGGQLATTGSPVASMSGFQLTGGPTGSWDAVLNASTPTVVPVGDRWPVVGSVGGTSFTYGGPGGTELIPGTTTADDTPGVGTGANPSGLGAMCTFQTQVSNVPQGKVTCIDGSAGTACRGNVGTSAGYAPIRNIAISAFKKVTFWANGTCTGTGTQFNHGRIILPVALQAQANLSYRIDSVYATCATGYPTTPPTC